MSDIEKAIKIIHNVREVIIDEVPDSDAIERNAYDVAINLAIQALQEKADRDNMRCKNCKYFYKSHCICEGICEQRKPTDFCSYFETKESEEQY